MNAMLLMLTGHAGTFKKTTPTAYSRHTVYFTPNSAKTLINIIQFQ